MALVGVQTVEVVNRLLDLGAVVDLEAHADEDVLELVYDDVHGVLVAAFDSLAGQGDIQGLGLELCFQRGLFKLLAALVYGLLELGAHTVGHLAHGRTLLGGQLAHLLQNNGELTLLAQVLHAQRVQRRDVRRGRHGLKGRALEHFELFFHLTSSIAKT